MEEDEYIVSQEEFAEALMKVLLFTKHSMGGRIQGDAVLEAVAPGSALTHFHLDIHEASMCAAPDFPQQHGTLQ